MSWILDTLYEWSQWLWPLAPTNMTGFLRQYFQKKDHRDTMTQNNAEILGAGNLVVQTAGENSSVNVNVISVPDSAIVLYRAPGICLAATISHKTVFMVEELQELRQQGKWGLFNRLAEYWMEESTDRDETLLILLETAVGDYFLNCLDSALKKLEKAMESHDKTANPTLHLSHILYIKAAIKRKTGPQGCTEAEIAIHEAKQMVQLLPPGIISGKVFYDHATLIAQQINETEHPKEELFQDAKENFIRAISHFKAEAPIWVSSQQKVSRAHVGLSLLLLDVPTKPGADRPRPVTDDDMRMAENCLKEVDGPTWEDTPSRTRCYWHLAKSDLAFRKHQFCDAKDHANKAMEIAQQPPFPFEVSLASSRLEMLKCG